jgi:hypothetical protein
MTLLESFIIFGGFGFDVLRVLNGSAGPSPDRMKLVTAARLDLFRQDL